MYDFNIKAWTAECRDDKKLKKIRELSKPNPEEKFLLADHMLAQSDKAGNTARAVWLMEKCANGGYARAACAMGQLFHVGWAVHKDKNTAVKWYELAVKLGSEEAALMLKKINSISEEGITDENKKKDTKNNTDKKEPENDKEESENNNNKKESHKTDNKGKKPKLGYIAAAVVVVVAVAGVLSYNFFPRDNGEVKIIVNENTQLERSENYEDYAVKVGTLISSDSDDVKKGKASTSRVVVKFKGKKLDLSAYNAIKVISGVENRIIIQFGDEKSATDCINELDKDPDVEYVYMDGYNTFSSDFKTEQKYSQTFNGFFSDVSGYTYMSWGSVFLGFDYFAAYLKEKGYDDEIIVAVIDTGFDMTTERSERVLDGMDFATGRKNALHDSIGHGTHVAGTIIDATQGLNVKVLPIKVFPDEENSPANDLALILALEYADNYGADVVNLSLGGYYNSLIPEMKQLDEEEHALMTELFNDGAVIVSAAGNEAQSADNHCPGGHFENCITVSAFELVNADNYAGYTIEPCNFTNYGPSVDIAAPGEDITSWGIEGDKTAVLSGTSMATPHISALAAMLKLLVPDANGKRIQKYINDYSLIPPLTHNDDSDYWGKGVCQINMFAGD